MKVVKRVIPKTFEPYELTIGIESQEEHDSLKLLFSTITSIDLAAVVKNNANKSTDMNFLNKFLNGIFNAIK